MNPLAAGIMALGGLIFVLGLLLVQRNARRFGLALSLVGLFAAALPLVVTILLFR